MSAAGSRSRSAPHAAGTLALLAVLLVLAWSFNYIFGKLAIQAFRPASAAPAIAAIGARSLLAALVMLLLAVVGRRRGWLKKVERRDLPWLLFLGFTGITLNQYFFVLGLKFTSVAHAALIYALTPVCVLLLAALWGQERITTAKALGLALALAGVALLVRPAAGGGATRWGDFLELVSTLSFAVYTVFGKAIVNRIDTFTFTLYTYVIGALCVLPLVGAAMAHTAWARVPALGWWSVLYMALAGSLLAYWIYYDIMRSLSAAQVSALSYLQPVVASLAGLWILGEALSPGLAAGGGAIVLGVYLAERGPRRPPATPSDGEARP